MFTKQGPGFFLFIFGATYLGNFLVMTNTAKHNGKLCVTKYTFFLANLKSKKCDSETMYLI